MGLGIFAGGGLCNSLSSEEEQSSSRDRGLYVLLLSLFSSTRGMKCMHSAYSIPAYPCVSRLHQIQCLDAHAWLMGHGVVMYVQYRFAKLCRLGLEMELCSSKAMTSVLYGVDGVETTML